MKTESCHSSQPADGATAVADAVATTEPATRAAAEAVLRQGPGGPLLVITSAAGDSFGVYYGEILRNEGLNLFSIRDITTLSAATLAPFPVAILADMELTADQVTLLTSWVNTGGKLIAMRPDKQLADLLGLTAIGDTLAEGYLQIDTSSIPGQGLVDEPIQYHGIADRYTPNGATSLATLYSDAITATPHPAVTLRSVGTSGGQAAAFAYDLARSIVYTRQGNPAWVGQERDEATPIRSNDLFFGRDGQPDWNNLDKAAIPQADEQQRLLANLILTMMRDTQPLTRFWYFPHGKKAVIVMTGDDHGHDPVISGTAGRFAQYQSQSMAHGVSIRGTSYLFLNTPLSDDQAAAFHADGFEIGLHLDTGCADFTSESLDAAFTDQLARWQELYPSLPAPVTHRIHCLVWSDWDTLARLEHKHGIRLDTNYYYWPQEWVNDRPGFFNGTGMPMRFAGRDGELIDVYQATTQMTDESGQSYPFTVDTLLDRALGPEGYYGAFVVNAHTDNPNSAVSDSVVASALARGVPVITARQLLEWLDGRNTSTFSDLSWDGTSLSFTITPGAGAHGLQAMLPTRTGTRVLTAIARDGTNVAFSAQGIKGVEYAIFTAAAGNYSATYVVDTTPPTVSATVPAIVETGVLASSDVAVTFSEAMDPATINASTFELRDPANTLIDATVSYDVATRTATLTPTSPLVANTTYTAVVKGGATGPRATDLAGNALDAEVVWSFTTDGPPACPCSIWDDTITPSVAAANDTGAVELGVKFQAAVDGFITGMRFYKGSDNTGPHIGSLWANDGTLLAQATFTNESAAGWQDVQFATPVAITANTTYVASYHAPAGRYAIDRDYFAQDQTVFTDAPLRALPDGASGGNGVFLYGPSGNFPTNSFRASNYWVDVIFQTV